MFYTGQIQNLILKETVNVLHWTNPRKGPWMYLKEKSAVLYDDTLDLYFCVLKYLIPKKAQMPNVLFKKRNWQNKKQLWLNFWCGRQVGWCFYILKY